MIYFSSWPSSIPTTEDCGTKVCIFFADALITRLREDFAIKTGAIVIVNRFYAVLDLIPAKSRGVNSKIAALGVAADGKPAEGSRRAAFLR